MRVSVRNLDTEKRLRSIEDVSNFVTQDKQGVKILIILCPLFKRGRLNDSTLLSGSDISVWESRIRSKWVETTNFIKLLSQQCTSKDIPLHTDFLFADNGTPINDLTNIKEDILREHELKWHEEIEPILRGKEVTFKILRFSDIAVEVPRFVNISKSEFINQNPIINEDNIKVEFINRVKQQLEKWFKNSSDCPRIKVNRKNKKRVSRLLGVFDLDSAFVMCTTYLGKRFRLPRKFENSVFIWFERMDVLLTIDDMLDEFINVKKVMVKV